MDHFLDLSNNSLSRLRQHVFPVIAKGDAILFLGAGASVSKHKFLSKDIIEFHKAKIGSSFETDDLTEYVDVMSSISTFDRNEFDDFVTDMLSKIRPSETHKMIASIDWRTIITSNQDLAIERAYDEIVSTPRQSLKLRVIRNQSEYLSMESNDEVRYVKLNGCISDKKRFPLVISTQDFVRASKLFKVVLRSLENLSPNVMFLSVGYSYADPFGRKLIDKFDSYNFRRRNWMLRVDPFVQDDQLAFLMDNRVCVIKCKAEDFFQEFKKWQDEYDAVVLKRKKLKMYDHQNKSVSVPNYLAVRIGDNLSQLSEQGRFQLVSPPEYYKGEEPTFDVVRKNLDVVKKDLLENLRFAVVELCNKQSNLIPVLFITGGYGVGKTTCSYRLVNDLIHDPNLVALGFEVLDARRLSAMDIGEAFAASQAKNILLVFNRIEVDSSFKALIDFRVRMSVEQFDQFNIVIIASIRENILQRQRTNHEFQGIREINIETPFNEEEAVDLVTKLSESGLLVLRDFKEKNAIAKRIVTKYGGDTFISLISLLTKSKHINILRDAYNELSPKAKEAFLYTSLLYRFGIMMPLSLLQSVVSKDWDAFRRDVLEYDCKGILIQETGHSGGTEPDLFFRTKHQIISDSLVKMLYPNEDSRFEKYKEVIQKIFFSSHNSRLVVDLLKAIRDYKDLSSEKIHKLFDICSQEFSEDPHFVLHYAMDLQSRLALEAVRKAIDKIIYVESLLERRNHRLIHRRAALNFDLARAAFQRETELKDTLAHLNEARELFEIKRIMDPFSHYSYLDYIRCEIWMLQKVRMAEVEHSQQLVRIQGLFDQAEQAVYENIHIISQLKAEYIKKQFGSDYLEYLNTMYDKEKLRPYSLILKHYYYQERKDHDKSESQILELEDYSYLDDAAWVLYKYYGRNLHKAENRKKLFDILRKSPRLSEREPARFHYYSYIAEAYNKNFNYSFEHIAEIRSMVYHFNPELQEVWRDEKTGEPVEFEGILLKSGKFPRIRVIDLQQTFGTKRSPNTDSIDYSDNSRHKVTLHFLISGIRAQLVN